MQRRIIGTVWCLLSLVLLCASNEAEGKGRRSTRGGAEKKAERVEMFSAMDDGRIDVKFIAKDSTTATVLIRNKTDVPLSIELPNAFAAFHAQIGGGAIGGGGGGLGAGVGGAGGGGGAQAAGGGFGGGGGGAGFGGAGGGGGGGFFSLAPDKVRKIKTAIVCLEHGKPEPTARMKYIIRPIESFTKDPRVAEVCRMLGRRELHQNIAQAATWNLQGVDWTELSAMNRVELKLANYYERFFNAHELAIAREAIVEASRRASSEGDYPSPTMTSQTTRNKTYPVAALGKVESVNTEERLLDTYEITQRDAARAATRGLSRATGRRVSAPHKEAAPTDGAKEELIPVQSIAVDAPLQLLGSPSLIDAVDTNERVQTKLVQTEVEVALAGARRKMSTNPELAKQDLKTILESVRRIPEIREEVLAQLLRSVRAAIRQASRQQVEVENRRAIAQENRATAIEASRLVERTARDREHIKQLMAKFGALLDEKQYEVAEVDIAQQVRSLQPAAPIGFNAVWMARNMRNVREMERLHDLRHRQFVNTLYTVEASAIPFPDDEPIVYPSPERWRQITKDRKKYASVDLGGEPGSAEQRITEALQETTTFQYLDTPLADVIDDIKLRHNLPILLDVAALEDFGIGSDTPITLNLPNITLKSALRLLLSDLELTYLIQNEVMQITTVEEAETKLITKVYPVGDLVIPIGALSGGGGGLGGGGLGGGGGGFGGGGGGF